MKLSQRNKKLAPIVLAIIAFVMCFVIGGIVSIESRSNTQGYYNLVDEKIKAGEYDWDGLITLVFGGFVYGSIGGVITWGVAALTLSNPPESEEN